MHPWEKEEPIDQPYSRRSICGTISGISFGLGLAVLIYGTVIYQSIFMKDKERKY